LPGLLLRSATIGRASVAPPAVGLTGGGLTNVRLAGGGLTTIRLAGSGLTTVRLTGSGLTTVRLTGSGLTAERLAGVRAVTIGQRTLLRAGVTSAALVGRPGTGMRHGRAFLRI